MENFINAVQDALDAQINEAATLRSQLSNHTDCELIAQWADIEAILTRATAELTGELVKILQREGR
jgi:hypothetical protein